MMELQYKKDTSRLCRSLEEVPISDSVRPIASEFEAKIERPVLYLLDSNGDKNYSNRHPFFKNQFWVTVKPQVQKCELDRLVLVGLYRGVLERKRLLWATPKQEFKDQVKAYSDERHKNSAYEMVARINSFISTIDGDLYLQQYKIQTSEEALQKNLDSKVLGLEEYIQLQTNRHKGSRYYQWYKESEISNLLDSANLYRHGKRYRYRIEKMIKKIKPKSVAEEYLRKIDKISDIIKTAYSNYTVDSTREIHDKLLLSVIEELKLDNWLEAKRWDVKEGEIPIPQVGKCKVYSYIPEDLPNQDFMVKSIRYAREILAMIEENCSIFDKCSVYPITCVTLVDSSFPAACVNGNSKDGYFISFMSGIFYKLKAITKMVQLKPELEKKYNHCWPMLNIREELYKYTIFFVAAHEYAHILNGDCETETLDRSDKENKANIRAKGMLKKLIGTQSKYHNKPCNLEGVSADETLMMEAMRIMNDNCSEHI